MLFDRRPFAALITAFALGLALVILVPNLGHDLFAREHFAEFGSRGATVSFDFFVFAFLAVPSTAALALALAPWRRRLATRSPRTGFAAGLAAGLSVGAFAGIGLLEELGSRLLPVDGAFGMIAASALTGIAAAVVLAVVAATGSRRSEPAS